MADFVCFWQFCLVPDSYNLASFWDLGMINWDANRLWSFGEHWIPLPFSSCHIWECRAQSQLGKGTAKEESDSVHVSRCQERVPPGSSDPSNTQNVSSANRVFPRCLPHSFSGCKKVRLRTPYSMNSLLLPCLPTSLFCISRTYWKLSKGVKFGPGLQGMDSCVLSAWWLSE